MSTFNADEFFASQPEPPTLQDSLRDVEAFLKLQKERKRKVVLITVSCPFVPVDNIIATQYSNAEWWYNSSFRAQCVWRITLCVISTPELTEPLHSYATSVRFLDNFSAGTRGSSSAEHFLRTNDYAVIFMHRQHSLQPFSRHYSHSTHSFLDLMDLPQEDKTEYQGEGLFPPLSGVAAPSTSSTSNQGALLISEPNLTPLRTLLHSYKLVNSLNLLHQMHFTTVQEYLFLLRGVSRLMAQYLGPKALYYLAAAVSDFFIPQQKLSEHKIQSGKGSLILEMDQVPKILKPLVSEWSQSGYIVSFKLETDDDILLSKAKAALDRYGHQLVIANSLHKRKVEVALVDPEGDVNWIRVSGDREIEEDIVKELQHKHRRWISEHESLGASHI